jgi:hypothetical protein
MATQSATFSRTFLLRSKSTQSVRPNEMDKLPSDQLELFKAKPRMIGKSFRGANGFELWYWRLPKGTIRVQLSDGQLIDITKESAGRSGRPRLYTRVPGHEGRVQGRNLKPLLAQLALIDQMRALNRSIQIKLKQQDDAARTLSDLTKDNAVDLQEENTRLLAECETDKAEIARLRDELAEGHAVSLRAEGSSPLRNDVRLLRPELALKLGVAAALLFQQLSFLLRIGVGRIIDRQPYITHTSKEWKNKYFPFYSEWTIERAFKLLEKEDLVVSKQADGRDSRVKSFRLSPEGSILLPGGQEKAAKCRDVTGQNAGRKEAICSLPSFVESDSSTTPTPAAAAAGPQIVENDTEWLARLASKHGFDAEVEWPLYVKKCKRWCTRPTRKMFEESWISNIQPAALPKIIKNSAEIEPAEYSNWFAITYPNRERPRWRDAPSWLKDEFNRAQKERSAEPADSV